MFCPSCGQLVVVAEATGIWVSSALREALEHIPQGCLCHMKEEALGAVLEHLEGYLERLLMTTYPGKGLDEIAATVSSMPDCIERVVVQKCLASRKRLRDRIKLVVEYTKRLEELEDGGNEIESITSREGPSYPSHMKPNFPPAREVSASEWMGQFSEGKPRK